MFNTFIHSVSYRKLEMARINDYEVPSFIEKILKDQIEIGVKEKLLR